MLEKIVRYKELALKMNRMWNALTRVTPTSLIIGAKHRLVKWPALLRVDVRGKASHSKIYICPS